MGYALIGFELLLASLLWVALFATLAARTSFRAAVIALLAVAIAPPLLLLTSVAILAGAGSYPASQSLTGLHAALSVLVVFVLGTTTIILWRSRLGSIALPAVGFALAASLVGVSWQQQTAAARTQATAVRAKMVALTAPLELAVPSDADNAAIAYRVAFTAWEGKSCCRPKKTAPEYEPFDVDDADPADPLVAAYLARYSKTVSALVAAAAIPDCRFAVVQGPSEDAALTIDYAQLRTSARLLRLHARSELAAGRVDSAIDDVQALFRMARHATRDRRLAGAQASFIIEGIASDTLARVLPVATDANQLKRLKIDPAKTDGESLYRTLRFEELAGLAVFDNLAYGPIPTVRQTLGDRFGPASPLVIGAGETLYKTFLLPDQLGEYRDWTEAYQWLGRAPYHDAEKGLSNHLTSLSGLRDRLPVGVLDTKWDDIFRQAALAQAHHEAARIALGASRYRLEKGKPAESVADLVPDYLAEAPVNPFTGEELVWQAGAEDRLVFVLSSDATVEFAFKPSAAVVAGPAGAH